MCTNDTNISFIRTQALALLVAKQKTAAPYRPSNLGNHMSTSGAVFAPVNVNARGSTGRPDSLDVTDLTTETAVQNPVQYLDGIA